jgi:sorbitol-specific phosphotransferase system component IIC
MKWIQMAQDRICLLVFVNMVMNIFGSFKRRVEDFIEYLSDYQLLKNCLPWNYILIALFLHC